MSIFIKLRSDLNITYISYTLYANLVVIVCYVRGCCGNRIASLLRRMYACPLMGYHISVNVKLPTVMAQRPNTLKPDLQ